MVNFCFDFLYLTLEAKAYHNDELALESDGQQLMESNFVLSTLVSIIKQVDELAMLQQVFQNPVSELVDPKHLYLFIVFFQIASYFYFSSAGLG